MKKAFSLILSFLLVCLIFGGCTSQAPAEEAVSGFDGVVDLHSELQESYLLSPCEDIAKFAKGKKALDVPDSFKFEWTCPTPGATYTFQISENSNMQDAVSYSLRETRVEIYNLKLDTEYYYTYYTDGFASSGDIIQGFKTSGDAPRNLYVEGVKNVRDLGGWMTENGTRTNQGLIFRCGRLNESSAQTPVIEITEKGIRTMRDELGVTSEIDLRKVENGEIGGITQSPLGEDIKYFNCPMVWEGNIFTNNQKQILKVFKILSDESNYPLIFHCNIGTDRTGMIAFLINALCGVSEADLKRDYLFSNFADIGGQRSISNLENSGYYQAIIEADGDTFSEKTFNCLASFGVPEEQLREIVDILTK